MIKEPPNPIPDTLDPKDYQNIIVGNFVPNFDLKNFKPRIVKIKKIQFN